MLTSILVFAMMQPTVCQLTIGVGKDGAIYSDRFRGWFKVSQKTLANDSQGGCYNDNNPLPITSITVNLATDAPKAKTDLVFSILNRNGWSRDKVHIRTWDEYPQKPR